MTRKHEEELTRIIHGIALREAYKVFSRSVEEIEQSLWIYILEEELKKGELDGNLVADICYKKIVDMIRYDMNRNSVDINDETFDESEVENVALHSKFESSSNYELKIMVQELMKKFPEGSKERIFLDFWATYADLEDHGYDTRGSKRQPSPENQLAYYLGYANSGSCGYRSFRNKMREFVKNYMEGNL